MGDILSWLGGVLFLGYLYWVGSGLSDALGSLVTALPNATPNGLVALSVWSFCVGVFCAKRRDVEFTEMFGKRQLIATAAYFGFQVYFRWTHIAWPESRD